MDAAVVGQAALQRLDDLLELGRIPMLQQQVEEGMRIEVLQVRQRRGIRRETGLVGARLRHVQFFEQHLLKLLRRPEVDLVTNFDVGTRREVGRRLGE